MKRAVNPNNQESTCSFEYSAEEAKVAAGEGTVVPCSQPLGAGGAPVTATAAVTGLHLKTTYFYRALAENAAHEKTADATVEHFETEDAVKPSLAGEAATDLTEATATLAGNVNPNGAQITACTFEYGTDTGYGPTVPCVHPDAAELGAGHDPVRGVRGADRAFRERHLSLAAARRERGGHRNQRRSHLHR